MKIQILLGLLLNICTDIWHIRMTWGTFCKITIKLWKQTAKSAYIFVLHSLILWNYLHGLFTLQYYEFHRFFYYSYHLHVRAYIVYCTVVGRLLLKTIFINPYLFDIWRSILDLSLVRIQIVNWISILKHKFTYTGIKIRSGKIYLDIDNNNYQIQKENIMVFMCLL